MHEENSQLITFNERDPEAALGNLKDTTLLAWFKLNQSDPEAKNYKYHEIPEHYVWNRNLHKWTTRKKGRCIG